jgi:hypothetical protein
MPKGVPKLSTRLEALDATNRDLIRGAPPRLTAEGEAEKPYGFLTLALDTQDLERVASVLRNYISPWKIPYYQ